MKRFVSIFSVFLLTLLLLSSCSLFEVSETKDVPESIEEPWVPNAPFSATEHQGDETVDDQEEKNADSAIEVIEEDSSTTDATQSSDNSSKGNVTVEGENTTSSTEREEKAPLTQRLVIPEGYTLARIGMTLEDMGIATVSDFIEATENGDFSEFPLIADMEPDPHRAFDLEGYLYPDTYEIYTEETLDSIIRRLLSNTEKHITAQIRKDIEESGYTIHEIFTLASIIEKESFGKEQMPRISSVLHNRLDIGMRLQCDVTITYVEGAIKPFIQGDENRYNKYYNTYEAKGLPAGPICNPSIEAIQAALEPADTNYLYFLTDEDKNFYYTDDYDEHLERMEEFGIVPARG